MQYIQGKSSSTLSITKDRDCMKFLQYRRGRERVLSWESGHGYDSQNFVCRAMADRHD